MKCTGNEWDTCQVEKMGCNGCFYDEKEIMSKESFEEVIRNIELINNITLYGRTGIKYNVEKLWEEIKELQADNYTANNIISDYIDITSKHDKMINLMAEIIREFLILNFNINISINEIIEYFKYKANEENE